MKSYKDYSEKTKILKIMTEVIAFGVILFAVNLWVFKILEWKDCPGARQYYRYNMNMADVMVYGSSHAHCTINSSLMWKDEGIAICNMSENGQQLGQSYYYIKESLKTQSPKLILVELYSTARIGAGVDNGNFYRNTLGLKWSDIYIKNARYTVNLAGFERNEKFQYFKWLMLKFPVFHSRYKEVKKTDFEEIDITKGRYAGSWSKKEYPIPKECLISDIEPLERREIEYLDKIVELAREKEIALIFFVAPYVVSDEDMKKYNYVKKYAVEKEIPFINFNEMYEEIGFDFSNDMRDEQYYGSHMNNYGAEKVTNYLTRYIVQNYDIPDRRGNERYNVYQTICDNWLKTVEDHNNELKKM